MLAQVYAAALVGIETQLVEVEVDVQMQGLPGWSMVGLLETAVKEARDRVLPALRNSGYKHHCKSRSRKCEKKWSSF